MMKKINILILTLVGLFILGSCSKEPSTAPLPVWSVIDANYTTSMTAVVILPPSLDKYAGDNDLIAAFVSGDCRGIGELVKQDSLRYYFLTIRGFDDESANITIKYYNTKESYLFTTGETVAFQSNGSWGILDEPIVLDLSKVQ